MDKNIEKTMDDLEDYRKMKKLRGEVLDLVVKYCDDKLDPDIVAGVLMAAGCKVSFAKSAALMECSEFKKGLADALKGLGDEKP